MKKQKGLKLLQQRPTLQISAEATAHLVHHLLGLSVANAEPSSLVIGAVGAGDQLSEGSRTREPGLQVQLLTGCMI